MRTARLIAKLLPTALTAGLLYAMSFGQSVESPKATVRLLDEFGPRLGSEERSVRFDAFFSELGFYSPETLKSSTFIGYVLLYCGKVCGIGEIEGHMRGIEVKMHRRGVPRDRVRVVNAGYRENMTVELWIVPNDKVAPVPRSTVNIRQVKFTKGRFFVSPYDCCDNEEAEWKALAEKP